MTRSAWFCPSCQKHHAPHVDTCPEPVDPVSTIPLPRVFGPPPGVLPEPWGIPDVTSPYYPEWMKGTGDPCAACEGKACGNAFCPKRMIVTCEVGEPLYGSFRKLQTEAFATYAESRRGSQEVRDEMRHSLRSVFASL